MVYQGLGVEEGADYERAARGSYGMKQFCPLTVVITRFHTFLRTQNRTPKKLLILHANLEVKF